jgi:V-type H+-transporting ATPase subunit A
VELGPGLLSTIFDGIQRPLKAIAISSGDVFIPRGVDCPALDRKKAYEFNPAKVKVRVARCALLLSTGVQQSSPAVHGSVMRVDVGV